MFLALLPRRKSISGYLLGLFLYIINEYQSTSGTFLIKTALLHLVTTGQLSNRPYSKNMASYIN